MKRLLILGLISTLCQIGFATSVPSLINYQGRLTDQQGNPLVHGNYGIEFRLWDSPTGTNLIWGQKQNVAVQANGLFNIMLGAPGGSPVSNLVPAVNDLSFAFGASERFLGVLVVSSNGLDIASPVELMPRSQILSVPFAVSALHGVPPGSVMSFAGTNLPPGWVLCDGSINNATNPAYAALYAAIGKIYGSGDGSELSFTLPDLRGRTVLGSGKGTDLSDRVLSQRLGSEVMTLQPKHLPPHSHQVLATISGGSHTHSITGNCASDDGGSSSDNYFALGDNDAIRPWPPGVSITGGSHFHSLDFDSQGDATFPQLKSTPFEIMPPSIVLRYIIKL